MDRRMATSLDQWITAIPAVPEPDGVTCWDESGTPYPEHEWDKFGGGECENCGAEANDEDEEEKPLHYTAWLTTSRDCLATDYCDVAVLRDEVSGYRDGADGKQIPEYTCAGEGAVFAAVLSVHHDDEDANDVIFDEADRVLHDGGWRVEYPDFPTDYPEVTWQPVTTGCVATVTRIEGEQQP